MEREMTTTEMLNADLRKALIGYEFRYMQHDYTISEAKEVMAHNFSVDILNGIGQYAGLVRAEEQVGGNITCSYVFEIYGTYRYENLVFVNVETMIVKHKIN